MLTVAANFWPRFLDLRRFPAERKLYRTAPGVQVLVQEQQPEGKPAGRVVLVHGLEGSGESGYMRSMAQRALEANFAVHRFHMRSCGGTEALCGTGYHSGLTSDLLEVLRSLAREAAAPPYLTGYSLGGNLVLKLAGELGPEAAPLLAGVCAVSAPIDLAESVRRLEAPANRIYELNYLRRLRQRIRVLHRLAPERYPLDGLERTRSVREFDDRFTAPAFGFRDAADYYATQSSLRFLERIRIPALLIQAKDDPMIPFALFESPAVRGNPCVEVLAVEHGGHLGFLSRRRPRFWLDQVVLEWMLRNGNKRPEVPVP